MGWDGGDWAPASALSHAWFSALASLQS